MQEADVVYVERRKSRHKSLNGGLLKIMDWIFEWLTSYGTNKLKMVIVSFVPCAIYQLCLRIEIGIIAL